jgi:hypothetical protein
MFWVLQKSLFNEPAFAGLLRQLERQGEPYAVVDIKQGKMIPEPDVPEGPVMALGAIAMGKIAQERGWIPGRFDENLDCQTWKQHYGSMMFNDDMTIEELDRVAPRAGKFFARPAVDSKSFTGCVVDWEGFEALRDRQRSMGTFGMRGVDLVACASVKKIFAEYRFFVVDGDVITGSLYKRGNSVYYSDQVEAGAWEAARAAVALWTPNRAFALDVAQGADGFKVLEINAINSAGFYALDMGKFVAAISGMDFSKECAVASAARAISPKKPRVA